MNTSIPRYLIAMAILLFACNKQSKPTDPIKGLWTLFSMEKKSDDGSWEDWNGGMQGYLLYDGTDNMALHLSTKDFHDYDNEYANFSDTISIEDLKHITNTYYYMGKYNYDYDEGLVTHQRISHSNPKDWGKKVERRFSFSGDTLIIVPVEESNSSLKLKWIQKP